MSSRNSDKSKTLRALERLKQAHVLDARQKYSEASGHVDRAERDFQDCVEAARSVEESLRSGCGEGAAISVTTWDLARRYLVETHAQITQRGLVRERAVQKQDQVGEKMQEALVERKIVQHHAEKIGMLIAREEFSCAARESDELWLLRRRSHDAN